MIDSRACTTFGYRPLLPPYTKRVYAITVSARRLQDGTSVLVTSPNASRCKAGQNAEDRGVPVDNVVITRDQAARYFAPSKEVPMNGAEYFDRTVAALWAAGSVD
jgi:hypothetical protein